MSHADGRCGGIERRMPSLLALVTLPWIAGPGFGGDAAGAGGFTLFLAGDTILIRPWSGDEDPAFRELVGAMRSADVAIANLETVVHDFEGYAQADSGGTWLRSPPEIADELAWAGVDMVSHANNHSFDYGSQGVLANRANLERAGIALAGSGEDLQAARSPRFFGSAGQRVALVSAASTFVSYGRASQTRRDLRGRPGLNPLRSTSDAMVSVSPATAAVFGRISRALGFSGRRFGRLRFEIGGIDFRVTDAFSLQIGERPEEADLVGNLAAVREAASRADVVVFALHEHGQGSWLRDFGRAVIDAGADVLLVHGPHEVRGIEIYRGKPIFYGLGDFAFQPHLVDRHPDDAYAALGLGLEAGPADIERQWRGGQPSPTSARESFEGAAAVLRFDDSRRVSDIELLPLDLRFEAEPLALGRPRLANAEIGRRVINAIAEASEQYGTVVRYEPERGAGIVGLR